MPEAFEKNLAALRLRFPELAEFALSQRDFQFSVQKAKDGGIFYAAKRRGESAWMPLSNPDNPIAMVQNALSSAGGRLSGSFCPALIVGLAPGYALDSVYSHFKESAKDGAPFRHIYALVNSPLSLCGWLASGDRTEILSCPEVEFHLASKSSRIIEECEADLSRSHLFIPVSELPPNAAASILRPLEEFFLKREDEAKVWREESASYYASISDEELARILSGKAGRKPRLLMPTHHASTVIQFSARDTCELFGDAGWETQILKIERDLPPWRLIKAIRDFKPDLFLFIDHLRTEDAEELLYPADMLFATWVQDSLPAINCKAAAEAWNKRAEGRNRDFLIGYVDQVIPYGYERDRLFEMPMVVNSKIFHPVELSPEDKAKYACDVCFASNRGETTERALEKALLPALDAQGFTLEVLKEVHDALWADYRSEKTYSSYAKLQERLCALPAFNAVFEKLDAEAKDYAVQRVFWLLNDLIYRYVVLEWLDECAQAHPGFKLKLYGRGWAKHPRFGKYAAGVVEHGPELNKAFNAAKLCLHLNSMEDQHQRLFEILSGGGALVARKSKDAGRPAGPRLKEALRSLASSICASKGESPASIDRSLEDWLFPLTQERSARLLCGAELRMDCARMLFRRLACFHDWIMPSWRECLFDGKAELLAIVSRPAAERSSPEASSLMALYEMPRQISSFARSMLGCKDDAALKMRIASMINPDFANFCFEASAGASFEELSPLFKKLGRPCASAALHMADLLAGEGRLAQAGAILSSIATEDLDMGLLARYAACCLRTGADGKAEDAIEKAYMGDSSLRDLRVRAALAAYSSPSDCGSLLRLIEKDEEQGRLSPYGAMALAKACRMAQEGMVAAQEGAKSKALFEKYSPLLSLRDRLLMAYHLRDLASVRELIPNLPLADYGFWLLWPVIDAGFAQELSAPQAEALCVNAGSEDNEKMAAATLYLCRHEYGKATEWLGGAASVFPRMSMHLLLRQGDLGRAKDVYGQIAAKSAGSSASAWSAIAAGSYYHLYSSPSAVFNQEAESFAKTHSFPDGQKWRPYFDLANLAMRDGDVEKARRYAAAGAERGGRRGNCCAALELLLCEAPGCHSPSAAKEAVAIVDEFNELGWLQYKAFSYLRAAAACGDRDYARHVMESRLLKCDFLFPSARDESLRLLREGCDVKSHAFAASVAAAFFPGSLETLPSRSHIVALLMS